MSSYEAMLHSFIEALSQSAAPAGIPLGISNRHIHLSQQDVVQLFGEGYVLTQLKELSQPGQYACKETVTICGPKGAIEGVRVLGPARKQSQVEILSGDRFKLGIQAPVRQSGDLANTPGITVVGAKGSVVLSEGVIIAQRHIHMCPDDAQKYQVTDGQIVQLALAGERGGIYSDVIVRVDEQFRLECHLDMEEANAMGLHGKSLVTIK